MLDFVNILFTILTMSIIQMPILGILAKMNSVNI